MGTNQMEQTITENHQQRTSDSAIETTVYLLLSQTMKVKGGKFKSSEKI